MPVKQMIDELKKKALPEFMWTSVLMMRMVLFLWMRH